MSSTLYFLPTTAHLCIFFLPTPATGIPLSSSWQVQVPYTEIGVSAFSRSPSDRADTFPFPSLLSTARKSLVLVSPISPHFLALRSLSLFPNMFIYLLYCTPPPHFSTGGTAIFSVSSYLRGTILEVLNRTLRSTVHIKNFFYVSLCSPAILGPIDYGPP